MDQVKAESRTHPVVFFSHQWCSFSDPDPSGDQYSVMVDALAEVVRRKGWQLGDVRVWIDYCSIPQRHAGIQSLAIRSLACYSSSAQAFIIIAPSCRHVDLGMRCDLRTYQRRMWCRAEQVCHSLRNGTANMWVAAERGVGSGGRSVLAPLDSDSFRSALRIFDGELTCCRRKHKDMVACDRESLVVPILGLYGELFALSRSEKRAANEDVRAFLEEIEENCDAIFPPEFERVSSSVLDGKPDVVEKVLLFGDLVTRMKEHVVCSGTRVRRSVSASSDASSKGSQGDELRFSIVHGGGTLKHGVELEPIGPKTKAPNDSSDALSSV